MLNIFALYLSNIVVSTGSGPIPRKTKGWQSKKGKENEQEKEGRKAWDVGV